MTEFIIRPVVPEDMESLIELCALHAAYEECLYDSTHKSAILSDYLFRRDPKLYCLVVEQNDNLMGYATYMKQFSTWDAYEYVYMDCLFLIAAARGLGIGKRLMRKIEEETFKVGCTSMQWQTPIFNTRAAKFYLEIGAEVKEKMRFFKGVGGLKY